MSTTNFLSAVELIGHPRSQGKNEPERAAPSRYGARYVHALGFNPGGPTSKQPDPIMQYDGTLNSHPPSPDLTDGARCKGTW